MANTPFRTVPHVTNRRLLAGALVAVGWLAGEGCIGTQNQAPVPMEPTVSAADRAGGLPAPDIEKLLGQMSLAEKVGQMTQASRVALHGAEVRELFLGSVLNGGNDMQEYPDMARLKTLATDFLRANHPVQVAAVEAAFGKIVPMAELDFRAQSDIFHYITAELYDAQGRTANLTGAAAGVAVDAALAQLGRPYVWDAAGPSTFDCSGLTLWAWGHAGIGLPHFAADQALAGVRVAPNELLPGDLILFGSGLHHVGLYLGAGFMIDAPDTGDYVKIQRVSDDGDFSIAVRL